MNTLEDKVEILTETFAEPGISCSVYRYQPNPDKDQSVILALQEAVNQCPAYGFNKLFHTLRRHGHQWNHKRIYRVYCLLKLNLRRGGKKCLPNRYLEPLTLEFIQPGKPTQTHS